MNTRTREETVVFKHPFVLVGFGGELPPGEYRVETDEELLQGVSFPSYRRTLVLVHLQDDPDRPRVSQTVWTDPSALDAALLRDAATADEPAAA